MKIDLLINTVGLVVYTSILVLSMSSGAHPSALDNQGWMFGVAAWAVLFAASLGWDVQKSIKLSKYIFFFCLGSVLWARYAHYPYTTTELQGWASAAAVWAYIAITSSDKHVDKAEK